jgi:hypothetical protein
MIAGGILVCATGTFTGAPIEWLLPTVEDTEIAFSLPAFVAIALPMLILAMGPVERAGLGGEGYKAPINLTTVVVGINSVVNALFGGPAAIVVRTGVAIFAALDAGPAVRELLGKSGGREPNYRAGRRGNPVMSLIGVLQSSYVFALTWRCSPRCRTPSRNRSAARFASPAGRRRRRGDSVRDRRHYVYVLSRRGRNGHSHSDGAVGTSRALADCRRRKKAGFAVNWARARRRLRLCGHFFIAG